MTSSPLSTLRHPEFRRGARDMAHAALGLGAWGLVTGVAMVKSGLSVQVAITMSLMVFAGSAQLSALPLMVSGAPTWIIWATALCVNLRFVIFSAVWRPYFHHLPRWQRCILGYFSGDLNYVMFMKRFPDQTQVPEQLPYFWGGGMTNWVAWQGSSIIGIVLAHEIPTHWGLEFAGVLALLGVAASMLNDRSTWFAAAIAATAAIASYALPLRLNILVAIAAAVAAGLSMEAAERVHRTSVRPSRNQDQRS